ncbi:hypothetical protein TKK_0019450 [Trichogramma kaykai]
MLLLPTLLAVVVCVSDADFARALSPSPQVTTQNGRIVGHIRQSFIGEPYEAYEGIPYALPPTGDRRFEPPVPASLWRKELKATERGQACIGHQRYMTPSGDFIKGGEDCLYLNIYVPQRKSWGLMPTLVYLHGGVFQFSTLEGNEQDYLMDHGVIFVAVAYRVGMLGFLSTEDEVVPGNMGLKDQVLALKWIHANIRFFGGDPNRVTLVGVSSGASSVHYHYLSKQARGLFHAGMSFSGTALNPWAMAKNSSEKAKAIARLVKCPTDNSTSMISCLKEKPAYFLADLQTSLMPWNLHEPAPFAPVVEKPSKTAFIDRQPIDILDSGDVYDVPWLTGVVSEEGIFTVGEFAFNETALKQLNDDWAGLAPHLLDYDFTMAEERKAVVAKRIREHYFLNEPIDKSNVRSLIHMVGDRMFTTSAELAARAQARANRAPVWLYYYNYRGMDSTSHVLTKSRVNLGVCHTDDVMLVLGNKMIKPAKTDRDFDMHKQMMQMWLSVARTGAPDFGPKWLPVDGKSPFLDFLFVHGANDYRMKAAWNMGQKYFWNSIGFNENIVNKTANFIDQSISFIRPR